MLTLVGSTATHSTSPTGMREYERVKAKEYWAEAKSFNTKWKTERKEQNKRYKGIHSPLALGSQMLSQQKMANPPKPHPLCFLAEHAV